MSIQDKRPCAQAWLQYARDLNVSEMEKRISAIDDEIERLRKVENDRREL